MIRQPSPTAPSTSLDVRDLTIKAGSRTLLKSVSACFEAGKTTLIVGPSGVGKSILLKILAGIHSSKDEGVRFRGTMTIDGKPARSGQIGVVFQDFALFDELSPKSNVAFARAHRSRGTEELKEETPSSLLEHLRVPTEVKTVKLSGGQRQRLAIARSLAFHPQVLLFDEPTSGLDSASAARVADLIRETQLAHGKTSVIVTHDYQALLPIADAVLLFDPIQQTLRVVPPDQWHQLAEQMQSFSNHEESGGLAVASATTPSTMQRIGGAISSFFQSTSHVAETVARAPLALVPLWRSPAWGIRYLIYYFRLVAGPSAWLYLMLAGAIVGFVTTYFTFRFLPFANYTEPLLIDDLLAAMGFLLYRVFVPVLATILIAARCGAAVASDVGGKRYGQQIDAMRSIGANPRTYLLSGILLAMLVGTPLLTGLSYMTACLASLVSFTATHPDQGPNFWNLHYFRELSITGRYFFEGTGWLLGKLLLCGFGTGLIAYRQGVASKHSTSDVSRGITRTVLWATLYVLIVHMVFAFWEFD